MVGRWTVLCDEYQVTNRIFAGGTDSMQSMAVLGGSGGILPQKILKQ